MKKRLRKKYHKGEFRQLGFGVEMLLDPKLITEETQMDHLDSFLDFVESNNIAVGGGGTLLHCSYALCSSKRHGSLTEEDRKKVTEYLKNDPAVLKYHVTDFVDIWYGPFPENVLDEKNSDHNS